MEPKQKREVERALRAAGFSRSQAVVAVAVASRVMKEKRQEAERNGEVAI